MPTRSFDVSTRRVPASGMVVAELHGDVGRSADGALSAAYDEAVAANAPVLVLNFADVAYINSTGIAVIVGLLARARKDGRQISVCALSDHYRTIFEITRLSEFMRIYPDEQAVLAGL